jgi:hypothetical protein
VTEHWNRQPDHFFTIGNGRRALHPDKNPGCCLPWRMRECGPPR